MCLFVSEPNNSNGLVLPTAGYLAGPQLEVRGLKATGLRPGQNPQMFRGVEMVVQYQESGCLNVWVEISDIL